MAEVSFIVPVYNAEKGLRRLIESVLKQEYRDLELILVDDGSKDGSGAICDEFAAADSRVQVVHKANSGVSDTRNKGLSLAGGKYIRFLDADDWIPDDSTKEMVRCAAEYDADLVVCDFYRVIGENVARKGSIGTGRVLSRKEYAEYMMDSPADYYYGVIWNKLYRRDILETYELRFDPSLSFCEDFIFNLEYVLHADRIVPLQVPVYYYVKTEGSLVAQNMNPVRIVNMKTSVYQYYDKFYRNILDEKEYRRQRPEILSFLVSAASDETVIPLIKGTNKLGDETVKVSLFPEGKDDLYTLACYTMASLQRYLNTVAMKNDLERRDAYVLYYLRHMGRPCGYKEIAMMTFLSQLDMLSILQRLALRDLVDIIAAEGELTAQYRGNEKLDADLDLVMQDLNDAAAGENKEGSADLVRLLAGAAANIRDHLK